MAVVCDVDRVLWQVENPDPEGKWTTNQRSNWGEQSYYLVLRRGIPLAQLHSDVGLVTDALDATEESCALALGEKFFTQFVDIFAFHGGLLIECQSWEEPRLWLSTLTKELTRAGLTGVLEFYPSEPWGPWPWGNKRPASCAVMHVLPTDHVRGDREVREQLVRVLVDELGANGLAENSTGVLMGYPVHAACTVEQMVETLLDSGELRSFRREDATQNNMSVLGVENNRVFRLQLWSRDDDSCRNVAYLVSLLSEVAPFVHEVYVHHGDFDSRHDVAYGDDQHFGGDVVFGSDRCVQLVPAGTDLSVPREKGWGVETLPSGQYVLRIGEIDPKIKTRFVIYRDQPHRFVRLD